MPPPARTKACFDDFPPYVRRADGLDARLLEQCVVEFDPNRNMIHVVACPSASSLITRPYLDALAARVFEFFDCRTPDAVPRIEVSVLTSDELH